MPLTSTEQLLQFKQMLSGRRLKQDSPVLEGAIKFIYTLPQELGDHDKREVLNLLKSTFGLSEDELQRRLAGVEVHADVRQRLVDAQRIETELDGILPRRGFFRDYVTYTSHSEAPLAYHFYCALVGVASTLLRRIFFDMGYFRIYPSFGILLLGPSGIKKTSASDIIVSVIRELEIAKVYSEKLTPEALVEAMKDTAQGVIYAPEMVVFFGKQKYNEGLVELITRFYDCPDRWESGTIMRGKHILTDVGLCGLMCSTPDWFIKNVPEGVFGGGFIARNIMVMQEASPRIEPIPRVGDPRLRDRIVYELAQIHEFSGQMIMSSECQSFYESWYCSEKEKNLEPEYEMLATYYQRKPSHAIRIAMCLHVAEHRNMCICSGCLETAVKILEWTEKFLPDVLKEMFKTSSGEDHDRVLQLIRSNGGVIEHSVLVRKWQSRGNAQQLRTILGSLKEGGLIREDHNKLQHTYILLEMPS